MAGRMTGLLGCLYSEIYPQNRGFFGVEKSYMNYNGQGKRSASLAHKHRLSALKGAFYSIEVETRK